MESVGKLPSSSPPQVVPSVVMPPSPSPGCCPTYVFIEEPAYFLCSFVSVSAGVLEASKEATTPEELKEISKSKGKHQVNLENGKHGSRLNHTQGYSCRESPGVGDCESRRKSSRLFLGLSLRVIVQLCGRHMLF